MKNSAIIALGGNALSPKKEAGTINQQFSHTKKSLNALMHLVNHEYNICITHGNGPQVGVELHRMQLTHNLLPSLPLELCVAETQGSIGYMIQQTLQNFLKNKSIDREVVTLITQSIVDENDPSIKNPNKFIGKVVNSNDAKKLSKKFGWTMKEQNKNEWRQVVPSPMPQYIEHGRSIETLVNNGIIVIASGGGGIPTFWNENNQLQGLDAVVDKDLSAALLGRVIKARELWIITDVDFAYLNWGQKNQKKLKKIDENEAKKYLSKGHFQSGTMMPKFKAALYFLKHHGEKVVITSISGIEKALQNDYGTIICKNKKT